MCPWPLNTVTPDPMCLFSNMTEGNIQCYRDRRACQYCGDRTSFEVLGTSDVVCAVIFKAV